MNFLAHVYLSGSDAYVLIGNFIGDFVKGRKLAERYEPGIVKGIELHRAIDEFTDSHHTVANSKKRLRPKYGHYSGVIVDILYDHFLAKNWNQYHDKNLSEYAEGVYRILNTNKTLLPERVKAMLPYMIQGNWLLNYSYIEGIQQSLKGMARRASFDSKMDEAIVDLKENYLGFEQEFLDFFPELKDYCENWLAFRNDK